MVSVHTFYFDDVSLNPAGYSFLIFSIVLEINKINEKEAWSGLFIKTKIDRSYRKVE